MIPWTSEALDLFHRQCEEHRDALLAAGADPDETFIDWESRISSRAAEAGESEVTASRVQTEWPGLQAPSAKSTPPAPEKMSAPVRRTWPRTAATVLLWIFGVLLPFGVLLFELISGLCAEILFDPLPTWLHVLLVALVPASNAAALVDAQARHRRLLGALNGAAIGISAFYALQFALPTPFALMAVAYFGFGFVPLAPLLSFLSALELRRRLRQAGIPSGSLPAAWRSALPAFLLALFACVPQAVVAPGILQAGNPDPAIRQRATKLLRSIGSRETMLRHCYRSRGDIALLSLLAQGTLRPDWSGPAPEAAQEVFYRVTGTPYAALPPPKLKGLRGQALIDSEWFDPALGGDQVAARIPNLTLDQSRLDGRIESSSGLAYLEWTLAFHNASQVPREARALIELPPGAVVSRVTLWINGEPFEAAFGGRTQTRQAYQQVAVRQRRDPVLVTTAGPDRVLLQCFPVPVDGSMKTRIGITAPLVVPDADNPEARLRLPAFAEQNFGVASNTFTAAWIESDRAVHSDHPGLLVSGPIVNAAVRGQIAINGGAPPILLHIDLPESLPPVCARDSRLPPHSAVLQTLSPPESAPAYPPALAIVLDGSRRMEPHADTLRAILRALPAETRTFVVLASDQPLAADGPVPDGFLQFAGGCDNGPALVEAADWSAALDWAPVLWLHAVQPLASRDSEALRQAADFSRGRLRILSHQFGHGANRLAEELADLDMVHPIPAVADPAADIPAALRGQAARWHRECLPAADLPADFSEGSTHVARLWAADEIRRLCAPPRLSGRDKAIRLARDWQLVTPVSGAVVLETSAQYAEHQLTPVDASTTPAIVPEPATGFLLMAGAALLLARRRRRRNT